MSNIFSLVPSLIFAFLLVITSDLLCSAQEASGESEVVLNEDHNRVKRLEWWQILLIVISILFLIVIVIVVLIRRFGVKKRQRKIEDFKIAYDENHVQRQMRNLYDIAPRLAKNSVNYKISPLTELEPTYTSKLNHISIHDDLNNYDNRNNNTYHNSNITFPPSYERKDNDAFSRKQKLRRSSTLGSTNRKVRYYLDNDNEGFEIVVADKGVKTSPRTLINEGYYTGDNNLPQSNNASDNNSTTNYYY